MRTVYMSDDEEDNTTFTTSEAAKMYDRLKKIVTGPDWYHYVGKDCLAKLAEHYALAEIEELKPAVRLDETNSLYFQREGGEE